MSTQMSIKALASFQDHITISSLIQAYLPSRHPVWPIPICLKDQFKQEINKMLQTGVLVPVHKATPWINSFMSVESRNKLGNLKLHICLDPTNLINAIIREPYHFRMPEDIAHLLADACVMTVCATARKVTGTKS